MGGGGRGRELRESPVPRKEGFHPFHKALALPFYQAREGASRRGRERTDSARSEVSHGNSGLDLERSLLFIASSAGES